MTAMRHIMGVMPDTPNRLAVVPAWTLGWRLQRALEHGGITVQEMATICSVGRSTISRWIHDTGAPPRELFIKEWALRCGVDYHWLATGQEAQQDIPAARRSSGQSADKL